MTKKQAIKSIEAMFKKMLPVFIATWSDEKLLETISFKTYRGGSDYASIEVSGDIEIKVNYSSGKIKIEQYLGKELSSQKLHDLIESIFKATFSYESMSSEKYATIKKIKEAKNQIKSNKMEIIKLEKHLNTLKSNTKLTIVKV